MQVDIFSSCHDYKIWWGAGLYWWRLQWWYWCQQSFTLLDFTFLQFTLSNFTLSIFTIHTFTLSISIWWWAGWCWWWWCWQCGIVAEPSCVALCVTLITPQHDSPKIPSPTPHAHADTYPPSPNSKSLPQTFLGEEIGCFSQKRSSSIPKFNQAGIIPKFFQMLNSAFWTHLMACGGKPRWFAR